MITFDYSYKTSKYSELNDGDFFLLEATKDSKILYIKHNTIAPKNLFLRPEDTPSYNAYNLTMKQFENINYDAIVINCKVNITVKPITA